MTDQKTHLTVRYTLTVEGLSCEHCEATVDKTVRGVDGVTEVRVDLEGGSVEVVGGRPHMVIEAIKEAGYGARPKPVIPGSCELATTGKDKIENDPPALSDSQEYSIRVTDMACAACVANVEKAIRAVPGVTNAAVNLVEKTALVKGGDPETVVDTII